MILVRHVRHDVRHHVRHEFRVRACLCGMCGMNSRLCERAQARTCVYMQARAPRAQAHAACGTWRTSAPLCGWRAARHSARDAARPHVARAQLLFLRSSKKIEVRDRQGYRR